MRDQTLGLPARYTCLMGNLKLHFNAVTLCPFGGACLFVE